MAEILVLAEHQGEAVKKVTFEMLTAARPMIQGVQVSAPFGRYSSAVEILEVVLPQGPPANEHTPAVHTTKPEGFGVGNL